MLNKLSAPPAGFDDIPLSWVAPPGWPTPPSGWSPPSAWKPERSWPRPAKNWQFWQRDPGLVAARQHAQAEHKFLHQAAWASSRYGSLERLNTYERALRRLNYLYASATSPGLQQVRWNAVLPPDHWSRVKLAHNYRGSVDATSYLIDQWKILLGQVAPASSAQLMSLVTANDACAVWVTAWRSSLMDVANAEVELFSARIKEVTAKAGAQPGLRADVTASVDTFRLELQQRILEPDGGPLTTSLPSGAAWQQAEQVAADALRRFSYRDAKTSPAGADKGLDVVGAAVAAQVKYKSAPTGAPQVQQLVGAKQSHQVAVFFSRSGFTRQARDYADEKGVALFTIELPNAVTPANGRARAMAARQ